MIEKLKGGAVWITWERQTRNRSLSNYIGVPLFEIVLDEKYRLIRYLRSIIGTVKILKREKPNYFFAQNPSFVLGLLAIMVRPFFRCKVIIDAHNAGVYGSREGWNLVRFINRIIINQADATIVTNSDIAKYVESIGGKALVLPDPLPKLRTDFESQKRSHDDRLKCLCITSWSSDEPFSRILEACSSFTDHVDFYFSGNYRKVGVSLETGVSPNVHLLGFVAEEEFFAHLLSSDFCIDLTSRSDCMVCGAYESVSSEIPIILSDTEVQKAYFSRGVVFCDNTVEGIVKAIREMKSNIAFHKSQVAELKQEILAKEASGREGLIYSLSRL